ncbi:MAG: glutamate--tRNA ligase, partial [Dehalococcoidia bacterium]|nr:glutamate--tRNA ligase [Dehalococcoidia bacterium]
KGMTADDARTVLATARAQLAALPEWTTDVIEPMLRALAQDLGLKVGQVFGTLRVATTGRTVAPGAPQTIAVLGRRRTLDRLDAALNRLATPIA